MTTIRRSNERGHADHGWLKSKHTFSFADYIDPKNMGFRSLRVINEDWIDGGQGFSTHGHKDMEIISYIVDGALEHKDSMGNGSVIRPGDVQYMSAGSGVRHSEYNPEDAPGHLLQIWIMPDISNATPRYGQKHFPFADRKNKLKLLVAGENNATAAEKQDAILIRQDAKIFGSVLDAGKSVEYALSPNRGAWLQVVKGELNTNGHKLMMGDAVAVEGESQLQVTANTETEFILFDLL